MWLRDAVFAGQAAHHPAADATIPTSSPTGSATRSGPTSACAGATRRSAPSCPPPWAAAGSRAPSSGCSASPWPSCPCSGATGSRPPTSRTWRRGNWRPPSASRSLDAGACRAARLHVAPALSPDGKQIAYLSERNFFFIDFYLADGETGKVIKRLAKSVFDANYETFRYLTARARRGRRTASTWCSPPRARTTTTSSCSTRGGARRCGASREAQRHHLARVQPRRQAAGVQRAERRHVRPLRRQRRRVGPPPADQRQVRPAACRRGRPTGTRSPT